MTRLRAGLSGAGVPGPAGAKTGAGSERRDAATSSPHSGHTTRSPASPRRSYSHPWQLAAGMIRGRQHR